VVSRYKDWSLLFWVGICPHHPLSNDRSLSFYSLVFLILIRALFKMHRVVFLFGLVAGFQSKFLLLVTFIYANWAQL